MENPSPREYVEQSAQRTVRWLHRCAGELERLRDGEQVNPGQVLFGINQGGTYEDIRIDNMKSISQLELPGYAIGGLAVGEPTQVMYDIIEAVEPYMPADRPRYLMGVGTPSNIIEGVARGVDFFDCVMPARNARHGKLFTWNGTLNMKNVRYITDSETIDSGCGCPVCRRYSRGYISHLLRAQEILGLRLCVMHNLYFYNELMARIRDALDAEKFDSFREKYSVTLGRKL